MPPSVAAPTEDPTAAWGELLGEVVTDAGYVDYDYLERHRGVLDEYVAWIGRDDVVPPPSRKRNAFWINAYNALVMWQVLEDGRPASVKDPSVNGRRPWNAPGGRFFFWRAYDVGREHVSLWDIEHERLRLRTQDFRVHAALNCGARSCPPLRAELYDWTRLDAQLREQMRRWVADPERGVWVANDEVVFNPIFDWFERDFRAWSAGDDLCAVVARYTSGTRRRELEALSEAGCPHRFAEYDWRLNDAGAVEGEGAE